MRRLVVVVKERACVGPIAAKWGHVLSQVQAVQVVTVGVATSVDVVAPPTVKVVVLLQVTVVVNFNWQKSLAYFHVVGEVFAAVLPLEDRVARVERAQELVVVTLDYRAARLDIVAEIIGKAVVEIHCELTRVCANEP